MNVIIIFAKIFQAFNMTNQRRPVKETGLKNFCRPAMVISKPVTAIKV
jgi:hypothetical protein